MFRNLETTVEPELLEQKVFVIVSFVEKIVLAAQKSKHRESWP
jgi:hypothetical protein